MGFRCPGEEPAGAESRRQSPGLGERNSCCRRESAGRAGRCWSGRCPGDRACSGRDGSDTDAGRPAAAPAVQTPSTPAAKCLLAACTND